MIYQNSAAVMTEKVRYSAVPSMLMVALNILPSRSLPLRSFGISPWLRLLESSYILAFTITLSARPFVLAAPPASMSRVTVAAA